MNRILVDRRLNNLGIIKDKTITIDVNENSNFLLNDTYYNKYIFNVKKGNVNILCILKEASCISFELNIENGCVSFNNFSHDCKNQKIEVNLNMKDSLINIYNSYICCNKQNVDIEVTHNYSDTESNVYNNGVTIQNGSICFNTITEVKKKKKGCKVIQDGKIIPLNNTNENRINPVLLIDEYEVDAKHAAFIGKFKEEQLFYLESRGLTKKDAINLLLNGLLFGTMDIDEKEKEILKKLI